MAYNKITAIIFDMYGVIYDGRQFNTELIEVIKGLKRHYKIGLVSNISKARLDALLADPVLDGLFDATLASSETMFTKPHPELFETIAYRLDVELKEAIFIDDGPDNVLGAEALGMRAHVFKDNVTLQAWFAGQGVTLVGTD